MLPQTAKGKNKGKGGDARPASMHVELYNLKSDPHETTDVAAQHPEIVAKIEKVMREQHTPSRRIFRLPRWMANRRSVRLIGRCGSRKFIRRCKAKEP